MTETTRPLESVDNKPVTIEDLAERQAISSTDRTLYALLEEQLSELKKIRTALEILIEEEMDEI